MSRKYTTKPRDALAFTSASEPVSSEDSRAAPCSRSVQLAGDLRQAEPMGWVVFCDADKTERELIADKRDALELAEDIRDELELDELPIYPLWAGENV